MINNYENQIYSKEIHKIHTIHYKRNDQNMTKNYFILELGLIQFKQPFELGNKYNIWPSCFSKTIEYHNYNFYTGLN
jgi:hypothetical protein